MGAEHCTVHFLANLPEKYGNVQCIAYTSLECVGASTLCYPRGELSATVDVVLILAFQ
jgi:uncharacterized protein (DUF779 family)